MSSNFKAFRFLLYPLSVVYGMGVSVRNFLFDQNILHSQEFPIPVITVGNITVGGTGKTPFTEYLLSLLQKEFSVAVLSRGYKRKTKGFQLATISSSVNDIGDEPKQIKQKFPHVHVAVENKRVKGIERLMKEIQGLDVIILDDAFQHRYVKPGLSLLLIDYNLPFQNDQLLPYGKLREKVHEKSRANILIVTKSPETLKPIERRIFEKNLNILPYQNFYFTTFRQGYIFPVFDSNPETFHLNFFQNEKYTILLVTGIANPHYFKQYLESLSDQIIHLKFRDHHAFSEKDIRQIISRYHSIGNEKKIIITTEKDAMRLKELSHPEEFSKLPLYYITVHIHFTEEYRTGFDNQILNYVRQNKRNRIVHPQKG